MAALSVVYRHIAGVCCLSNQALQMIDNLPGYLDIFAAGMICAYLYVRFRDLRRFPWFGTALAVAGFAFLIALLENLWASRFVDQWSTVWEISNRSWIGVAFILIALGSLFAFPAWKAILTNPVLLFFGAISYNLYLYHQPVAREMLWHHFPPYSTPAGHGDDRWAHAFTWLAFAVTIAQAAIVTYAFERPLLRVRRALPPA